MHRRTILSLGAAGAALLGLAAAGVASQRHAMDAKGLLTPSGRDLFAAVAAAVLEGLLPSESHARNAAIDAHLARLETAIAGFPPAIRAEIGSLATLLVHPAGRIGLTGLSSPWATARTSDVQAMLQSLRASRLPLRQQIYHALRDLTNGAFFADRSTWGEIGYPGPIAVDAESAPGPARA